jgi:coproporphyrinogen III oxidase-like Fe-S oxidoreductase
VFFLLFHNHNLIQGTVFGKWYGEEDNNPLSFQQNSATNLINMAQNRPTLPSADISAFMYKYAAGYLRTKGFEHYEISSYAYRSAGNDMTTKSKPSNRSVHNQNYWAVEGQWYAFGLGATSYINGNLIARPRALIDYSNWVAASSEQIISSDDDNSPPDLDKLMDIVLKRLRTSEGLSLEWIRHRYTAAQMSSTGEKYVAAILEGAQLGLELEVALLDEEQQILRLVDPNGFLFSNSIISSIFVSMEACRQLNNLL